LATPPVAANSDDGRVAKHVVWVNQHADFSGGAEHYIYNTVNLLREYGVRSTLLYDVAGEISPRFTQAFAGAHPLVDARRQLDEIAPDLIYAHRVEGVAAVEQLLESSIPVLRFFHDHKLFCLREHKYTTLGHQTCTKQTGLGCYACLGFVERSGDWPGVKLHGLGGLRAEQEANKRFAGFAVGSSYMAEHVASHGFDAERVHALPLYARRPDDTPEPAKHANQLVFAGSLVRGKGLDTLLLALARVAQPVRLIVAGDGRQGETYRAMVDQLNLADRVEFVGRLPSDELTHLVRGSTALVVPSRSPETFGLSGLEALSWGVPVIATDVGGMGEWLRNEETGLATPAGDDGALAAAIERLLSDDELVERLGGRGRELYFERFTPEQHVERLIDVFESIVSSIQG
jgi:glycosyltransferase involved in cell wall biosynthesis